MIANSAPIVTDAFPKKELGKAMGINSMVISVASVIGPILGGLLLHYGWRSVFFINVPVGILVSVWAGIQLKELDVLPKNQTFDWSGTITFSVGMLAFLLALSFGGFVGWTNIFIIALFITAVVFSAAFIKIENKVKQPMLDMKLLKTKVLALAFGSNLLNGISRGALNFLLVFYFQGLKGMDPIMAGIMLTPFALSMMIVAPVSGWLSDRYEPRILSGVGLLISAAGLIGFMFITPGMSLIQLSVWMCIMGFGSGMFFSPNTNAIMRAVPVERRGIAAGIRTMMNNAGNVISIGLAMAIISTSIDPHALQGLFAGTQVGSAGIAVGEFISGLRVVFTISFIFSLTAAGISFLKGPQPVWDSEPEVISTEAHCIQE
jgi:MFS family permease